MLTVRLRMRSGESLEEREVHQHGSYQTSRKGKKKRFLCVFFVACEPTKDSRLMPVGRRALRVVTTRGIIVSAPHGIIYQPLIRLRLGTCNLRGCDCTGVVSVC